MGFISDDTPSPWIEANFKNAEYGNAWQHKDFARRVLKTHSSAQESPWVGGPSAEGIPPGAKVVVPTRNAGDAAVSMYWHTCPKGNVSQAFNYLGSMSHFVSDVWLEGNVESGDFWAWHASWLRAAEKLPADKVLFIAFEDMKADPAGSVRKIANFCSLPCDDALVDRVVAASSFGEMKKQFEKQNEDRRRKGLRIKEDHIREGSSGGWRKSLSPEVGALLLQTHARRSAEVRLPADFFGPF